MINVTGLSVNFYENVTKVTVEVYDMIGSLERLKDKLIITLPGQYQNIDEDLITKIEEQLNTNGYTHNPTLE